MNAIRTVTIFLLLLSLSSWAADKHEPVEEKEAHSDEASHKEGDEHGEEGGGPNVGPGKAVEALDHEGLKLSAKAKAALGIKSVSLSGNGPHRVPAAGLVYFRDEVGVYRLRDGWFKLVEVRVSERNKREAVIGSSGLKPGDQVVVSGAARLRVVEMDVTSGEVGHGH